MDYSPIDKNKIDLLTTQVTDQKGRQIKNLGSAVQPNDAVTLQQVQDLIATAIANNSNINSIDSYPYSSGILHKLVHTFQKAVNFLSTISVSGLASFATATFSGAVNFSGLTASRILKLDGSKNVTSDKVDLAAPATDIQNTLGVGNGGTGQASFTAGNVLLGNGTSPINSVAGVNGALSLSKTPGTQSSIPSTQSAGFTTIQYKDWAGVNQSVSVCTSLTIQSPVITSVTLEASPLKDVSLTTNNFTNGVRTT